MSYFPVGGSEKIKVADEKVKISDLEFWKTLNADQLLLNPPATADNGLPVEYKGNLYLFTSDGHHLKFENGVWEEVGVLPTTFQAVVVYNNEIHALSGSYIGTNHYKWDGTTWTHIGDAPPIYIISSVVVYNNEIHAFGGGTSAAVHYKWSGTTWTQDTMVSWNNNGNRIRAVAFDGAIYLFIWWNYTTYEGAKWDGTTWTKISISGVDCMAGGKVFVYNNEIHMLGYYDTSAPASHHYSAIPNSDGTNLIWTKIKDLPMSFVYGTTFVYKGKIHIIKSKHYRLDAEQYFLVANQS